MAPSNSVMSLQHLLYQRLPSPARSIAASLRGLQLRITRYDSRLEDLVDRAVDRERWTDADWVRASAAALEATLEAAKGTSYYGPILAGHTGTRLEGLPVTPKAAVRDEPEAFWPYLPKRQRPVFESTSGTSGTPLTLRFTRDAVQQWFALNEARVRRWHGLSISDRWAMFGGQVVVPVDHQDPPFWVHNWPMHQLYVSTHHLSRRNTPAIAEALCRFRPQYLLGYPSSMSLLARLALEEGIQLPEVKVVLSNAEALTPEQREVISTAFRAPVRNTYGMAEAVAGASECSHGSMHLWPEAGVVEVIGPNGTVSSEPGVAGSLVLTGLLNPAMPLLRYDVGDRGTVPVESNCRCGRTLPVLGEIEGRSTDFIVTPDGRHVFWINPVFRDLPVAEAQVVQNTVDDVEVRIVPSAPWEDIHSAALRTALANRLGAAVDLRVTLVETIERDPSGKFRPVVSHVAHP